jgi:hypothetical protein
MLDLHRQLVDCLKIGRALLGKERSEWIEHPAVMMWLGAEQEFWMYTLFMNHDWTIRYGRDKRENHLAFVKLQDEFDVGIDSGWNLLPWRDDPRLHDSHKAALIRHNPEHYLAIWPHISPDLPMFWPTLHEDYGPHFYNV